MNSEPLSLSMPESGKGRAALMSSRASKTHLWALLRVGRSLTQPEYTSVAVRVRQNSPESDAPQWRTVSISKKAWFFVGVGVISADGYLLFKEPARPCPAFSLQGKLFLVLFQQPVDGGRAD